MKKLPIGVSSFESIITSDALYVDKTKVIYELIKGKEPKRYFFSRPRRFGKSLTCSTLKAIFSGHKELFKDLWIGKSDYEWQTRPVVVFDFSEISHGTTEALVEGLHDALNDNAERYSIKLEKKTSQKNLLNLLQHLGRPLVQLQ